jgi:hypothetical protein
MEFLRFGSMIPGSYWGTCSFDIIQNFKVDPDTKASIQLLYGDSATPVIDQKGKTVFAGPTYRDIFWQRLRFGTFEKRDMPNHGFLAILTDSQISGGVGAKWLAILKEAGFEFIRTVCNSVYAGQSITPEPVDATALGSSRNHLFGLFRNIGSGMVGNPFQPPEAWLKLDPVMPEAWEFVKDAAEELTKGQYEAHKKVWDGLPTGTLLTEEEVVKAGAPVILGGQKLAQAAQQTKAERDSHTAAAARTAANPEEKKKSNPFIVPVMPAATAGETLNLVNTQPVVAPPEG